MTSEHREDEQAQKSPMACMRSTAIITEDDEARKTQSDATTMMNHHERMHKQIKSNSNRVRQLTTRSLIPVETRALVE